MWIYTHTHRNTHYISRLWHIRRKNASTQNTNKNCLKCNISLWISTKITKLMLVEWTYCDHNVIICLFYVYCLPFGGLFKQIIITDEMDVIVWACVCVYVCVCAGWPIHSAMDINNNNFVNIFRLVSVLLELYGFYWVTKHNFMHSYQIIKYPYIWYCWHWWFTMMSGGGVIRCWGLFHSYPCY